MTEDGRNDQEAFTPQDLMERDIAGRGIQWVHSYVTRDRVYCVYRGLDEALAAMGAGR